MSQQEATGRRKIEKVRSCQINQPVDIGTKKEQISGLDMSRRSGRGFINTQEVLEKLCIGRAGAVQVMRSAKIGSPQYRTAMHLCEAIDDMVEKLTGDRTHFHDKPASTAPRKDPLKR
ncbi:hypothetical protein [Roseibium aggregatum]|nr:hypothetical protein [Roseibium aggregatum]